MIIQTDTVNKIASLLFFHDYISQIKKISYCIENIMKSKYNYLKDLPKKDLQLLAKKYNIPLTLNGNYKTKSEYIADIKKILIKNNRKRGGDGTILAEGGESIIFSPPYQKFIDFNCGYLGNNSICNLIETHIDENKFNSIEDIQNMIGKIPKGENLTYINLLYNYKILEAIHAKNQSINVELLKYITFVSYNSQNKIQLLIDNYGKPLSMYKEDEHNHNTIEENIKKLIDDICILNKNNIIHFDIKYDNVLYNSSDEFSIIDFGLSVKYENTISLIDKIYSLFNNNQIPSLYPMECFIIFLLKSIVFKEQNDMTKDNFLNNLKNNNVIRKKMFLYLSFALFPNTGLINKYRYVLDYKIQKISDNECIIYDKYNFFSKDGKINVNCNSNNEYTFTKESKETIIDYIFNKYYAIFENILNQKTYDEKITINDLITADYFKKIDVFYLGILFIYMNNLSNYKTKDEIIEQCLNSDYTKRYTIDSLKQNINTKNGGKKRKAKKIGGRVENFEEEVYYDIKRDYLKTPISFISEITFKDEDEKYEIDTSYKYSNRYTVYDDYIPENLEDNINEFITKIRKL